MQSKVLSNYLTKPNPFLKESKKYPLWSINQFKSIIFKTWRLQWIQLLIVWKIKLLRKASITCMIRVRLMSRFGEICRIFLDHKQEFNSRHLLMIVFHMPLDRFNSLLPAIHQKISFLWELILPFPNFPPNWTSVKNLYNQWTVQLLK